MTDAPRDPEELEATGAPASAEISARTSMGAVHLTVSDLERSLAFYRETLGLAVLGRDDGRASLGAGERELLVLIEEPGARPAYGHTGLYHFALLLPERAHLATLARARRPRAGAAGRALRPLRERGALPQRPGWARDRGLLGPAAGGLAGPGGRADDDACRSTSRSLLGELEDPATAPFDGLPGGTVMGHVHLKVAAIADTVAFYRDLLGFGLMAQLGAQAAFLAAGGYHHHLGANTWESAGASPPPPGSAALRQATILLPDAAERDRVVERLERAGHEAGTGDDGPAAVDPSGNALVLAIA